MALLLVLKVSKAGCCEQKHAASPLKHSFWMVIPGGRTIYGTLPSSHPYPMAKARGSLSNSSPEGVARVKPLCFPLPPGEFLQHMVQMLEGLCLLWILHSHHLLGIYLPRTRLLCIWEIPYGNIASHLMHPHRKRAWCALPCTVTENFYPVCVTSPKQPGQSGHSNAHGSAAQLRQSVGHLPQAWLCTSSTFRCAGQLWGNCFLWPAQGWSYCCWTSPCLGRWPKSDYAFRRKCILEVPDIW